MHAVAFLGSRSHSPMNCSCWAKVLMSPQSRSCVWKWRQLLRSYSTITFECRDWPSHRLVCEGSLACVVYFQEVVPQGCSGSYCQGGEGYLLAVPPASPPSQGCVLFEAWPPAKQTETLSDNTQWILYVGTTQFSTSKTAVACRGRCLHCSHLWWCQCWPLQ